MLDQYSEPGSPLDLSPGLFTPDPLAMPLTSVLQQHCFCSVPQSGLSPLALTQAASLLLLPPPPFNSYSAPGLQEPPGIWEANQALGFLPPPHSFISNLD